MVFPVEGGFSATVTFCTIYTREHRLHGSVWDTVIFQPRSLSDEYILEPRLQERRAPSKFHALDDHQTP
jgi:hypothetical protein